MSKPSPFPVLFFLAGTLLLSGAPVASAQPARTASYTWKSVPIVGGGFIDGVVFHPTAPGVRYARTDIGGAYRWDSAAHQWQPMMDWVSYKESNLMGVESIAVDPSDPNRVYLACGTYTNPHAPYGAILRSEDRGRTFQRTNVPFKFGGNEDGRGNGERLAVDPGDGRILYLGTRHNGLWRSRNRAATWTRVAAFPDITEAVPPAPPSFPGETLRERWQRMPVRGDGIVFVKFAPQSSAHKPIAPTQTIYAGVSLMGRANLFVSTDGGASWKPIPGEPTAYRPTRAALSSDGFLYIAYGTAPGPSHMTNGAVWKLNTRTGAWTDITPLRPLPGQREFGYAAVSVDAQHPRTLIVSTYGLQASLRGEEIYRSTDGGLSWKPIFSSGGVYDYSLAPYVKSTPIHWLFDIEIDPTNSNHAVFTTGYGGWETFDLTAIDRGHPTHWSILAKGIEETVALGLDSPAKGAHLVTAIGDYGGFVHWNLNRPAPEGSSAPPRMNNTTGIASAALHPAILVRVGENAEHNPSQNIGYSLDEGRTWQPTLTQPTPASHAGSIAVSADGGTWIWTPEDEAAYITHDRGATWTAAQGLPAGTRVLADPISPRSFYAISLAHLTLYRSRDSGASFTARSFTLPGAAAVLAMSSLSPASLTLGARGDPRGGQDRIYAAPGRANDLWLPAFDGLYHAAAPQLTADGHVAFIRLPGVERIQAFGFGKAAPHESYPSLYLAGTVDGMPGLFRSTDQARSWVRINDSQHQWGIILQVTGDPRLFGRVYVGTHGRGVLYGDPAHY